jgi:hypothetical protein
MSVHPGISSAAVGDQRTGLRKLLPVSPDEAAGIAAALTATLADLHAVGLCAGSLEIDDVVLDADGRPLIGHDPIPMTDVDAAVVADVRAVGRLLAAMLPSQRPRARSALPRRAAQRQTAALAIVARRAMAATAHGPSAAELADLVAGAAPDARLPGSAQPSGADPDDSSTQSARPYIAAVAVSAALFVAALLFWPSHSSQHPSAASSVGGPSPAAPPTTPPGPPATPKCAAVASALRADVDGDGCDDELSYVDGVLTSPSARFSIGEAADRVATGRWACEPPATLGVLRPATGTVFVADRWPGEDSDVTLRQVAAIAGAVDITAADTDGDGCDELVVRRADGSSTSVRPEDAP